ncbi:hypothetical protein B0A48_11480 [Cryoendolithus antarcticus]|uniref:Uncharacterized protein n=1 Tax=Cryoendolithus antarcticus TaxID=1507870 RepID=A0A1V8SVZ8_9PEZI|nr:hypothetical protein B0A48_11480 [Cryoendolithus antarcticus]
MNETIDSVLFDVEQTVENAIRALAMFTPQPNTDTDRTAVHGFVTMPNIPKLEARCEAEHDQNTEHERTRGEPDEFTKAARSRRLQQIYCLDDWHSYVTQWPEYDGFEKSEDFQRLGREHEANAVLGPVADAYAGMLEVMWQPIWDDNDRFNAAYKAKLQAARDRRGEMDESMIEGLAELSMGPMEETEFGHVLGIDAQLRWRCENTDVACTQWTSVVSKFGSWRGITRVIIGWTGAEDDSACLDITKWVWMEPYMRNRNDPTNHCLHMYQLTAKGTLKIVDFVAIHWVHPNIDKKALSTLAGLERVKAVERSTVHRHWLLDDDFDESNSSEPKDCTEGDEDQVDTRSRTKRRRLRNGEDPEVLDKPQDGDASVKTKLMDTVHEASLSRAAETTTARRSSSRDLLGDFSNVKAAKATADGEYERLIAERTKLAANVGRERLRKELEGMEAGMQRKRALLVERLRREASELGMDAADLASMLSGAGI